MHKFKIRLLVMDVDGTLTDGKIYTGSQGEVFKAFHVKDGYGIKNILPLHNITPVILSGRTSNVVEKRAEELGIVEVYQGCDDKIDKLKSIVEKYRCNLENVAFIGDDLNDIECLKACGFSGCPSDAVTEVKKVVDYTCLQSGGAGCVREIIDILTQDANYLQFPNQ